MNHIVKRPLIKVLNIFLDFSYSSYANVECKITNEDVEVMQYVRIQN